MTRFFAASFALLLTVVAVSSTCLADDLRPATTAHSVAGQSLDVRFRPIASIRFVELGGGFYSASRP